jgi:hypothetical protein
MNLYIKLCRDFIFSFLVLGISKKVLVFFSKTRGSLEPIIDFELMLRLVEVRLVEAEVMNGEVCYDGLCATQHRGGPL